MTSSGSYARGDQPRSVPDPDKRRHEDAARRQRAYNDQQKAAIARSKARKSGFELPDVGHPNEVEALVPIWGAGREALADAHDGDWVGAIGNGGVRQWLGERGYLKPGEHGHHWAISQGGWGKDIRIGSRTSLGTLSDETP